MFRKRKRAEETFPEPLQGVYGAVAEESEESAPPDWREPEPEVPAASDDGAAGEEADVARSGPRRKRGIRIGQFFTGGVLSQDEFTRRLPVIVYVVFLMLLYIANGFHIQHKHSELDRISDELKQLKTEAVTSSAVRMTLTRQSEIERLLRERNIPLRQGGTLLHVIKD